MDSEEIVMFITYIKSILEKQKRKLEIKKQKKEVISTLIALERDDVKDIISYLKKNELTYFNYQWFKDIKPEIDLFLDSEVNMYYTILNGRRMYFKRSWDKKRCEDYYSFLLKEQDYRSPHFYLDDELSSMHYKCVVDGGGAEGYFTLALLDKLDKAYIFECDDEWVEALNLTFKEYKHKVKIIPKFLTDYSNENNIRIEDTLEADERVDLIKLDVEGAEVSALKGAWNILDENVKGLVCVYHYPDEELEVKTILDEKDFEYITREGYIYFMSDEKQVKPYIRRGIVKFWRK